MDKQTANYITLKPISDRFNKVTKEISDDDIRCVIIEAMKEQIKGVFDFSKIEELTEEYIDANEEDIKQMIHTSIKNGLKL